eukprot:Skav219556  [mRNA]  locus=scaffold3801:9963:10646:+ [translate_table: standard]
MVKVFQNHYPERLKVAVVYPIPSSFVSLVRQVMWFVDENTRSKIDLETDEWPLLRRFGYRSEDLPSEIQGGYIGVGERWKPDRRKLLGLAYSFLLPHGRQVSKLEEDLYRCARRASALPSPPQRLTDRSPSNWGESDWSAWLFACCLQRPADSPDVFFFDSVDKAEAEPAAPTISQETEHDKSRSSELSSWIYWLILELFRWLLILSLTAFIVLLLGSTHKQVRAEL